MASFYNQATLSYNGNLINSNVTAGENLEKALMISSSVTGVVIEPPVIVTVLLISEAAARGDRRNAFRQQDGCYSDIRSRRQNNLYRQYRKLRFDSIYGVDFD